MTGIALRAIKIEAFSAVSASALAAAINAWVLANNNTQRSLLALDYETISGEYIAYLQYTE